MTSPLQRAPEQPPCSARAEALCLNGLFAVPERMAHYDPGPHLLFPEHRAIWRSMKHSPRDGGLWLWTLHKMRRVMVLVLLRQARPPSLWAQWP